MASSIPNANASTPVSLPPPDSSQPQQEPAVSSNTANSPTTPQKRSRASTNASTTSVSSRVRAASIKILETNPPPGMWAATGAVTSKAPTLTDIRRGSFSSAGWHDENQKYDRLQRRASESEEGGKWTLRRTNSNQSTTPDSPLRPKNLTRTGSSGRLGSEPFPAVTEEETSATPARENGPSAIKKDITEAPQYASKEKEFGVVPESKESSEVTEREKHAAQQAGIERQFTNGYVPPPKVPWTRSTAIGLKAFWKWFLTIPGFLITIYGLNVVAWGGMLFLLLCNAAPAMCKPTCDDIQSPRRIWIEIDSQVLNALFCVTGFGLAPWRFRDLYWWGWWRLGGSKRKEIGIRRLAGIHRGWFRLQGSDHLPSDASAKNVSPENPAVPIPLATIPDSPPTGIHAPPTKSWKMDFVLWMNASNTFFQVVLCFYMYHYNRYKRPSWATGTFVALGCIVAGVGGIMMYHEGKYVKRVEGVPAPQGYEETQTEMERQLTQQSEPAVAVSGGAAKS